VPLPVCARCAALYLSGAAGALAAWVMASRRGLRSTRTVLVACAVPTAATWLLEHLAGVPFTNVVRAVAALPLGAAGGWLFVQLLRYDSRLDGKQVLYS
jgi:hypothetical protein